MYVIIWVFCNAFCAIWWYFDNVKCELKNYSATKNEYFFYVSTSCVYSIITNINIGKKTVEQKIITSQFWYIEGSKFKQSHVFSAKLLLMNCRAPVPGTRSRQNVYSQKNTAVNHFFMQYLIFSRLSIHFNSLSYIGLIIPDTKLLHYTSWSTSAIFQFDLWELSVSVLKPVRCHY